jgi:hypothetical protein
MPGHATPSLGTYPFGQSVRPVVQTDRTPKRIFILGVYSSAVHARWISPAGKTLVTALAVASEPYIFWRGDGVQEILERIVVSTGAGKLVPASSQLNGPSGQALDDDVLTPLGLTRDDTWLCDLVPHTCLNRNQRAAVEREYVPRMEKFGLPPVTSPPVPKSFADAKRRQEVLDELVESQAAIVVLLGDAPIQHWLSYFDPRWKKLADLQEYGRLHEVELPGRKVRVLPLTHVRQIAALGAHSPKWFDQHREWVDSATNRWK